jgi:hypothetical protein
MPGISKKSRSGPIGKLRPLQKHPSALQIHTAQTSLEVCNMRKCLLWVKPGHFGFPTSLYKAWLSLYSFRLVTLVLQATLEVTNFFVPYLHRFLVRLQTCLSPPSPSIQTKTPRLSRSQVEEVLSIAQKGLWHVRNLWLRKLVRGS